MTRFPFGSQGEISGALRLDDDGALPSDLPPLPLPPAPWRVEGNRQAAAQTPSGFPLYL